MVRACEENGVTFMAGHVMNFNGVHHAKEFNQGVIGKALYYHRMGRLGRTTTNHFMEKNPWKIWRSLIYHHIHELDCVQFIMGGMPKPLPWQPPMLHQRRKIW